MKLFSKNEIIVNNSETNLMIQKNKEIIEQTNIYNNLKIVFIILLIIIFIILRIICLKNNDNEDEDFKPDKEAIYSEEKFDSYIDAFDKSRDFLNNNINGILLNISKVELIKKTNLSIVIPCLDCKNYILSCIRSIQNQDFSNFEIIIVNDASENDTSSYLVELQKEDDRIKIINNKMNMGLLYARSIGALSSSGKYIYTMDSDDMLLNEDVLSSITNIALKGNFDIIIFNSIYSDFKPDVYTTEISLPFWEKGHKPNLVLFQPDLGYYPISPSDNMEEPIFNEVLIHTKCIKTKVYIEALQKLGEERYSRYMVAGEDNLANYIIFNTAKSAKFIPKYGYLFRNNNESWSHIQNDKVIFLIYRIYIFDAMIDFSLNLVNNKKVLINYILYILNNKYIKDAVYSNDYNYNLFISCLDRFFNCSHISNEYKDLVRKKGKNLHFLDYNFFYTSPDREKAKN